MNPEPQTDRPVRRQPAGELTNITVDGNLIAGNQNNGGINVGCTAGNGFQADFGNYPNETIVVQNNRFSNVFNVNAPAASSSPEYGPWSWNDVDAQLHGRRPLHGRTARRTPAESCG